MGLKTSFDVDAVAGAANGLLGTRYAFSAAAGTTTTSARHAPMKIRPHDEGGDYCCGFIHYESLANCWVNGRAPDVLFCHVPSDDDQVGLVRARDAVVAVMVSAVRELLERRRSEHEAEKEIEVEDHL